MSAIYLVIFLIITWLGPIQAREQLKEMFQRRKELDMAIVTGGIIKEVPSENAEMCSLKCALEGDCMSFVFKPKTQICTLQRRAASLAERWWGYHSAADSGERMYWENEEIPAGARLKAHGLVPMFIRKTGGIALNILTGIPFPSNGLIKRWEFYRQYPNSIGRIEIFRQLGGVRYQLIHHVEIPPAASSGLQLINLTTHWPVLPGDVIAIRPHSDTRIPISNNWASNYNSLSEKLRPFAYKCAACNSDSLRQVGYIIDIKDCKTFFKLFALRAILE